MMSTTHDISAEALSLLEIPALDTLTVDQRRGAVCVWGADEKPLTAETAVDLGERKDGTGRWFPRACRAHTGERAYRALMDHAGLCEQCTDDAGGCDDASSLRRLRREGRR
ncbi:hypothetical protein AB0O01_28515 [Streptomyces sp. NPDC093252]|uniref:hypothetical protein n=1 Tax=Streptomyces sp. NPDC093252 TaxID=3154980 RepID=UPI00343BEF9C